MNEPHQNYIFKGRFIDSPNNKTRAYYIVPEYNRISNAQEDHYYVDTAIYRNKIFLLGKTSGRIKTYLMTDSQDKLNISIIPTEDLLETAKNVINKSFFVYKNHMYILRNTYSNKNQIESQNIVIFDLDTNTIGSMLTIQPSSIELAQIQPLKVTDNDIHIICSNNSSSKELYVGKFNTNTLQIREEEFYSTQEEILCWEITDSTLTLTQRNSIQQFNIEEKEIIVDPIPSWIFKTDILVSEKSRILFDTNKQIFILHDINKNEKATLIYRANNSNQYPIGCSILASVSLNENNNQLISNRWGDKNSFLVLTYNSDTNSFDWTLISTRMLNEDRYRDYQEY